MLNTSNNLTDSQGYLKIARKLMKFAKVKLIVCKDFLIHTFLIDLRLISSSHLKNQARLTNKITL